MGFKIRVKKKMLTTFIIRCSANESMMPEQSLLSKESKPQAISSKTSGSGDIK